MTRCESFGIYIVEKNCTIRQVAKVYGVSKSTVHNDLHKKLPFTNYKLYTAVQKILDNNLSVRHIRGGMATKEKYLKEKRLC